MIATELEKKSRIAAKCLVYVLKEKGYTPDKWMIEATEDYNVSVHRLDEITGMLCDFCHLMTEGEKEKIIYNGRNKDSRMLAGWYEKHLHADRKKEEAREEKERAERIITNILSKLTAEEIEFLYKYDL